MRSVGENSKRQIDLRCGNLTYLVNGSLTMTKLGAPALYGLVTLS